MGCPRYPARRCLCLLDRNRLDGEAVVRSSRRFPLFVREPATGAGASCGGQMRRMAAARCRSQRRAAADPVLDRLAQPIAGPCRQHGDCAGRRSRTAFRTAPSSRRTLRGCVVRWRLLASQPFAHVPPGEGGDEFLRGHRVIPGFPRCRGCIVGSMRESRWSPHLVSADPLSLGVRRAEKLPRSERPGVKKHLNGVRVEPGPRRR